MRFSQYPRVLQCCILSSQLLFSHCFFMSVLAFILPSMIPLGQNCYLFCVHEAFILYGEITRSLKVCFNTVVEKYCEISSNKHLQCL